MNAKLYVTDLDKSWLRSDLSVSKYSKNVWNTLIDLDIKLTYATARSYEKATGLLHGHKFKFPAILLNGALIVSATGDILVCNSLSGEIAKHVISIGCGHSLFPFVLGIENNRDTFLYTEQMNEGQRRFILQRGSDPRLRKVSQLRSLERTLTINFLARKNELLEIKEQLSNELNGEIEIKFAQDPYIAEYYALEVLHPQGDKAHSLRQLGGMLNITNDEFVVFGDNHNDIAMFECSGYGIAVKNAVDEIKAISDEVLSLTNDEDAIARYLAEQYKLRSM